MYQGGFFSSAFNVGAVGQRRQNNAAKKKQGNQKPNPQKQMKKKQKQKQYLANKQVKIQLMSQAQPVIQGGQINLAAAAKNFMNQQLLMVANQHIPPNKMTSPVATIPTPVINIAAAPILPVTSGSVPKTNTSQLPANVKQLIANVTQPTVKAAQPTINDSKPISISSQSTNIKKHTAVATPSVAPPTITKAEVPMETDSSNKLKSETGDSSEAANRAKPKWMKKSKLSRVQKLKATNMNLKRILQPKNAVVVLNEMLADSSNLSMTFTTATPDCAKATITVDNNVFEGVGHSKVAARNAAAEAALKHIILKKLSKVFNKAPETESADTSMTESEGGEKKVEEDGEISLGHVACFAMFKLFDAWSNDNTATPSEKNAALELVTTPPPDKMIGAKKLPENPSMLHPCMLLHQMHPNVVYDLVCVTGTSPKLCFTMKCSVNEKFYIGNGPNKKSAKKDAATTACKDLFNVVYENE